MLEKVITPFLSLSEAAEALVADGYHCDEQALIALAAQGELRLCFAYAGRLAQYSSDDFYAEVSGGEYREYDLTRGTEPESSGGFKGYLALPQMRVEHACLRHEDWNTMPVGRVQIALVMPGFRPDITPKSGYVLVRINLQYDEATDKSWDELELGAMSAPIGILSSELRAFVAGKSAAVSPVDKPLLRARKQLTSAS